MNNFHVYIVMYYISNLCLQSIKSDSDCGTLRKIFANASAQFTSCTIDNSRPITVCEICKDNYVDILDSYKNMSQALVNGTTCLDKFINQDRLQILQIIYNNNLDMWSRAKCDECYDSKIYTYNQSISNRTEQFHMYYNTFMNCTTQHENKVCTECMKNYTTLDTYYKSISNINEKIGVCMDIVDIMNTTWTFWSNNCCKYRKHNEYIFIGTSVGLLILTVVFYLVVQFCNEKKAPTIIQQSRFFESLNIFRD
ncbi:unnamed protein product [Phyllotreta striolata]|uniref:Osteopetrosis-associated transmembrane protein 1 n=1 Tax=Phyllotreta striolata TaxID=444603 RepID=A0A9N9TP82_PHYSR|nr:unnamed protein product [Phyllotreta striolata]